MRRLWISMSCLLLGFFVLAQASPPRVDWARYYGVNHLIETSAGSITTSDNCFISAGSWGDFNENLRGPYIIKINSQGDTIWTKYIYLSGVRINDLVPLVNNEFILGGTGEGNFCLIKMNSLGDTIWYKNYPFSNTNECHAFIRTVDGGFMLVGETYRNSPHWHKIHLVKTDSRGALQWQRQFESDSNECAYAVCQTNDRGYVVAGYSASIGGHGGSDMYLFKTDSLGNKIWEKYFGEPNYDEACGMVLTNDGYILVGYMVYNDYNSFMLITKSDFDGNLVWQKTYDITSNYDLIRTILSTEDGEYLVAGRIDYYAIATGDVWLAKLNSAGDTLWTLRSNTSSMGDLPLDILSLGNNNFLISGWGSSLTTWDNAYLVKISNVGAIGADKLFSRLSINNPTVSPNPVYDKVKISYSVLRPGMVEVGLYNQNGALVTKIFSGYQNTGIYQRFWWRSTIPTGLYFIKINTPDQASVIKTMIINH